MGQISISITKRVAFRDAVQEFSNVYTYLHIGLDPQPSLAQEFIDALVALEKPLHSSAVTFVKARVWSSGGTKAENRTLHTATLTGIGTRTANSAVDRERAVLIRWPAGLDVRGKPVYLRKWFHICGDGPLFQMNADILSNLIGFTASQRAALADLAKGFSPLTIGSQQYALISEKGRFTTGPAECHRYFEHHQLGDQWRV